MVFHRSSHGPIRYNNFGAGNHLKWWIKMDTCSWQKIYFLCQPIESINNCNNLKYLIYVNLTNNPEWISWMSIEIRHIPKHWRKMHPLHLVAYAPFTRDQKARVEKPQKLQQQYLHIWPWFVIYRNLQTGPRKNLQQTSGTMIFPEIWLFPVSFPLNPISWRNALWIFLPMQSMALP